MRRIAKVQFSSGRAVRWLTVIYLLSETLKNAATAAQTLVRH